MVVGGSSIQMSFFLMVLPHIATHVMLMVQEILAYEVSLNSSRMTE
jgi:hypothetical protein